MTLGIKQLATVESLQKAVVYLEDKIVDSDGLLYHEWEFNDMNAKDLTDWIGEQTAESLSVWVKGTNPATAPIIGTRRRLMHGLFFLVSDFLQEYNPTSQSWTTANDYVFEGFAYVEYDAPDGTTNKDWKVERLRLRVQKNGTYAVMLPAIDGNTDSVCTVRWDDSVADVERKILDMEALGYSAINMNLEGMKMSIATGGEDLSGNPAKVEYTLAGTLEYQYLNEDRENVEFIGTAVGYNTTLNESRLFKLKVAPKNGQFMPWSAKNNLVTPTMKDSVTERKMPSVAQKSDGTWSIIDGYNGKWTPYGLMQDSGYYGSVTKISLMYEYLNHQLSYMGIIKGTETGHEGKNAAIFSDGVHYLYLWDNDMDGEVELRTMDEPLHMNHYYLRTFEHSTYYGQVFGGLVTADKFTSTWNGSLTTIDNYLIKDKAIYQQFWNDMIDGTGIIDYRMDVRGTSTQSTICRLNTANARLVAGSGAVAGYYMLEGLSNIIPRDTDSYETKIADTANPATVEVLIETTSGYEDYPMFWKSYSQSAQISAVLDCNIVKSDNDIKWRLNIITDEYGDVTSVRITNISTGQDLSDENMYGFANGVQEDVEVFVQQYWTKSGTPEYRRWFNYKSYMVAKHVDISKMGEDLDNPTYYVNTWQVMCNTSRPYGVGYSTYTGDKNDMYIEPSLMHISLVAGWDRNNQRRLLVKSNSSLTLEEPRYSKVLVKPLTDYSDCTVAFHMKEPETTIYDYTSAGTGTTLTSRFVTAYTNNIVLTYQGNYAKKITCSEAFRALRGGAKFGLLNESNLEFPFRNDTSLRLYWELVDTNFGGVVPDGRNNAIDGESYEYESLTLQLSNGSYIARIGYEDNDGAYLYIMPYLKMFHFDFNMPWEFVGAGNEFKFNAKNKTQTIGHPLRLSKEVAQFVPPTIQSNGGSQLNARDKFGAPWSLKTPEIMITDTVMQATYNFGSATLTQTKGYYLENTDGTEATGYAVFTGTSSYEWNGTEVGDETKFRQAVISVIVKYKYTLSEYEIADYDFKQGYMPRTNEKPSKYCKITGSEIMGRAYML